MTVAIVEKYGPFKANDVKRVIREGYDYYVLSAKGTNYHVPKYICK